MRSPPRRSRCRTSSCRARRSTRRSRCGRGCGTRRRRYPSGLLERPGGGLAMRSSRPHGGREHRACRGARRAVRTVRVLRARSAQGDQRRARRRERGRSGCSRRLAEGVGRRGGLRLGSSGRRPARDARGAAEPSSSARAPGSARTGLRESRGDVLGPLVSQREVGGPGGASSALRSPRVRPRNRAPRATGEGFAPPDQPAGPDAAACRRRSPPCGRPPSCRAVSTPRSRSRRRG